MLGKEFLRESERQRGSDPADLHDWHETGFPSSMDLMNRSRAGDYSHRDKVNAVLDWSNLEFDQHLTQTIGRSNLQLSC